MLLKQLPTFKCAIVYFLFYSFAFFPMNAFLDLPAYFHLKNKNILNRDFGLFLIFIREYLYLLYLLSCNMKTPKNFYFSKNLLRDSVTDVSFCNRVNKTYYFRSPSQVNSHAMQASTIN